MIIRTEKTKNYSMVCNEVFRRTDLSARAKGLYAYIMTLPDDWTLYKTELYKHFTEGREALNTAFSELEQEGYITKKVIQGEDGKLSGWEYTVIETVQRETASPESRQSDNQPLPNTNKQLKTDKTNNSRFAPPSLVEVTEYMSSLQGFEKGDDCAMHDYYTANGWKVGRAVMKDWKATCRTWLRNKAKWSRGVKKTVAVDTTDSGRFAHLKQGEGK